MESLWVENFYLKVNFWNFQEVTKSEVAFSLLNEKLLRGRFNAKNRACVNLQFSLCVKRRRIFNRTDTLLNLSHA